MARVYPILPPVQITTGVVEISTGRVGAVPLRYERVAEFASTVTIASGTTTGTATITLPANVSESEIKSIRAVCTGQTFSLYLKDSAGHPIYGYSNISEILVDNGIEVPAAGNITVEVSTPSAVPTTKTVNVKTGVRYSVIEV